MTGHQLASIGTVWLLLDGLIGLLCAPMYRLERNRP